jgi:hypothetical protein
MGQSRCEPEPVGIRHIAVLSLAWTVALAGASTAPALAPIPAEEAFRSSPLGWAALSPDGRHLGTVVTDENDVKNLLVFEVKGFKPAGLRGGGEFEFSTFQWLGNERLVFNVLRDKIYSWGLYVADSSTARRSSAYREKGPAASLSGSPSRQRTSDGPAAWWS